MPIHDEIGGILEKVTSHINELESENSTLRAQISALKSELERARANFGKEVATMVSSIHARFTTSG